MTCADARDIILSADHNALRERTDPVLRQHLEACPGCDAAATQVVADVARLRAALIARGSRATVRPRRSPAKRVAMTLVPLALAAELAAFAFLGTSENPNPLAARRPVLDDSVPSMVPASISEVDTGEVVVPAPVVAMATPANARRDSVMDRDSVAPAPTVSVMPRARQRYAVIATSNPKITVVWLTKGDTL